MELLKDVTELRSFEQSCPIQSPGGELTFVGGWCMLVNFYWSLLNSHKTTENKMMKKQTCAYIGSKV